MRVALVYPRFDRSTSLGRDSVLLASGLLSHGIEVHVYASSVSRSDDLPDVVIHDVSAVRLGKNSDRSRLSHPLERGTFAIAATRAIRRERSRYDVVDVRQTAALEGDVLQVHGVVAAMQDRWPAEAGEPFAAARLRAAISPVLRPQIAVDRTIQRAQLRHERFGRVIAVTTQVRDDLVRTHGVSPAAVEVIAPPIDLDRLAAAEPAGLRRSLGLSEADPLLLFIGHDFERKGLDLLIAALTEVPPAHLVVVGAGDRQAVERRIKGRAGVRVHFVGRTDSPERYYAEADVFVLPTRSEPWGIPLIEAMAAGVPVVSTRIAGAASVVEQARAGLILPRATIPDLRDALTTLLSDPALRRSMGERGRTAAARFGARAHAGAVLETYRRAVADANPRRD